MYSLLFLACCSFLLSLVLTPVCRNIFRTLGLTDRPDSSRKSHVVPVPRLGGIPIALSYAIAYLLLMVSPLKGGALASSHADLVWKFLPAAAIVFLTGLVDDLVGLTPWQKLAGQLLASSVACWAGVRMLAIAGYPLPGWLDIPLTVLWLLACTNAFNLIDGVDGLAPGVGLFATVTMLFAALLLQNNIPLALATAPLAGALLAFLRYNFNPASIFLGDSGSLLIGFLLGCFGVIWSQKSATLLAVTSPLITLAVPLLDAGLTIARRFLRHEPIFLADRGHIHHRLLDRGLTPRRVALTLYGFCGLAAAFSLVQSAAHGSIGGAVIVLFCAITWIGVEYLGYGEFKLARHMLAAGAFRDTLSAQLQVRALEQRLRTAANYDACWDVIRDACEILGFREVQWTLAGKVYCGPRSDGQPMNCWSLRIPLSETDHLDLCGETESPRLAAAIAPLVHTFRTVLVAKVQEINRAHQFAQTSDPRHLFAENTLLPSAVE